MSSQQNDSDSFRFRRAAFYQSLKSKVGLAAAKEAALRINLNIEDCGVVAPPMHAPSRAPLLPPASFFTQSPFPPRSLERDCCLLVLNSVTSTPQWIRQPKAAWGMMGRLVHTIYGSLIPDGPVVRSCTSQLGVVGSIPKREELGKTGAPCVKVPGSSTGPNYPPLP